MPPVAPISDSERLRSLDVLRGVALLGILVMNSRNFALPLAEFDNPAHPARAGSAVPASDLWTWAVANVLFEDKMIAIFSMLFGAGIAIAATRAARAAWTHYRRMFWLLLIGAAHAYGLWYGDILNTYAICGMALFPLRRLRPGLAIGLGVALLTVAIFVRVGPKAIETINPPPTTAQAAAPESRTDRVWRLSLAEEREAYRGSWWHLAKWRARLNTLWHWDGCITFNYWRCGGFMLIGIGLVQLGVLSATRPASLYAGIAAGAYALGLALMMVGFWPQLARALGRAPQLSPDARPLVALGAWTLRYAAAAFVALGHVSVVMLLCRSRVASPLLAPLAAVGRMALTNYLTHTLIFVLVFDGWALGQWNSWRLSQVALLVVGVWAVQLIICPLWLARFRFGPLEWVWRSLTYWSPQPFLRRRDGTLPSPG